MRRSRSNSGSCASHPRAGIAYHESPATSGMTGNHRRLKVATNAKGDATLDAAGPPVVAGVLVVLLLVVLVLAPENAWAAAMVVGVVIGSALAWFAWTLLAGKTSWSDVWQNSTFRATRKANGSWSLDGVESAAWPLAALLSIGLFYVFARPVVWMLWTSLGGVLLISFSAYLVRRRTAIRSIGNQQ